jgi:3-oxoacyl-[acyl-carrier-protein] synthase II
VRAPRIAVSGVGLVSALGQSAGETFRALMAGERGIQPLQLFDAGNVRSKLVGEVRGLTVADIAPSGQSARFSRTDALAVAAAQEAALQARLPRGARVGVVLGGTTGGMFETEGLLSSPELERLAPAHAGDLVSYPLSASLGRVAEAVGGVRVTRSICSACSGGAIALVQAAAWLTRNEVDFVLAGGADGLCRLTVLGFNALGATDPELCRPFDRARGGLNLGEGAAVLVLEREASALDRGVEVLAWLDGYAVGAEGHHITHPEPTGSRPSELLRSALSRAGLASAEAGYVNAHGTGTPQNDAMEARSLLDVFGADATTWVSSSKAQLGHTLGAAGAIEAALTVLAVARGEVPPGVGLLEPELPGLRHVGALGRKQRLTAALSSSFGFGGMSCVLAFSEPARPAPATQATARRVAVLAATRLDARAQPEKLLDPERSRRFDAGSALAAAGAVRVTQAASAQTGLVLGTAFGNVERTMAFLARGEERGPRHVPPAEFPHLVPSAPAGNASVYANLTGPVFAVSDLAQSGEAAFAAACELIELGVATRIVAGAIAPRDAIVERVLGPLLDPGGFGAATRGEGAGFTLLAELGSARASGGVLAEVLGRYTGQLAAAAGGALVGIPEPDARFVTGVVLGVTGAELRQALEGSAWRGLSRVDLASEHGYHEALGAVALAVAVELVSAGELDRVLVLSGTGRSFTATLCGRLSSEA